VKAIRISRQPFINRFVNKRNRDTILEIMKRKSIIPICFALLLGPIVFISCEKENIDQINVTNPDDPTPAEQENCILAVSIIKDSVNGGATYLSVAESDGTAPYTYGWSTGETTATINVVNDATYSVLVTDAVGCTDTSNYTVVTNDPCDGFSAVINPTSPGSDTLYATPINGTPAFTYSWNTGETQSMIFAVNSGLYSVVITDANNCEAEAFIQH
jgi:hypothetical protein